MAGAFQSSAFAFTGFQEDAPVVQTEVAAGRSTKKHRRTHRYEVEIDGEIFEVRSAAEATQLLAHAREMARVTADRAVAQAESKQPEDEAIAVAPPVIRLRREQSTASDYLMQRIQAQVEATQAAIEAIYALAMRQSAQARHDDEDAVMALLMI
jgi:hypothetical protein